jgi:hypothetical protein
LTVRLTSFAVAAVVASVAVVAVVVTTDKM